MCSSSVWVASSNSTPARCVGVLLPAEPKLSLPGLALAWRISASTETMPDERLAISTLDWLATVRTMAKSRRLS